MAYKIKGELEVQKEIRSETVEVGSSTGVTNTESASLKVYRTSGTTQPLISAEAAIGGFTGASIEARNTLGGSAAYDLFRGIVDSDGDAGGPTTVFKVDGTGAAKLGNATLDPTQVNTEHTLLLPNKDGTLATLSDITDVGGVPLSGNNPLPLGSLASPGVGTSASRDDHVHEYAEYGTVQDKPASLPILEADFVSGIPTGWTYSRASTATYFDASGNIATAAIDTPRYERHPTTKKKMGLLIDPQSTNLFLYSQKFDEANWIKSQATATQVGTYGNSPLGEGYWELTEDTSNNEHTIRQSVVLPAGKNTLSVLVRDGGTMPTFVISFGTLMQISFDTVAHKYLAHYQGEPSVISLFTYDVRQVGSNVWLYSATVSNSSGVNQTRDCGLMAEAGGGGVSANFLGTSRTLIFAYMQIENKPHRTSYIPTTSSTATRSRDVLYYDNVDQLPGLNNIRGTMLVEATPLTGSAESMRYVDLNSQETNYSYAALGQQGYRFKFEFWDNNAQVDLITVNDSRLQYNTPTTLVGAWGDQDYAFAEGSFIEFNGLGGINPPALSFQRINIGRMYDVGLSNQDLLGAHFCIKKFKLWGERLTDTEIVKLSGQQPQTVQSAQFQKVGIGASSSATNTSYLLDINPGTSAGVDAAFSNIRSVIHGSKPFAGNRFPVGVLVALDNTFDMNTVSLANRYYGVSGVQSAISRNNASDTGAHANSSLTGGVFAAQHGGNLSATALTGTLTGITANALTNAGTATSATCVSSVLSAGGTNTGPKSATITTGYGVRVNVRSLSGTSYSGSLGTGYGIYLESSVGTTGTGSTIGTLYGLYIGSQPSMQIGGTGPGVVTDKWAIYQAGSSDKSYHAGKVLVGRATDDGSNFQVEGAASVTSLRVQAYGDGTIYPTLSRNSDGGLIIDSFNGGGSFGGHIVKVGGNTALSIDGNLHTYLVGNLNLGTTSKIKVGTSSSIHATSSPDSVGVYIKPVMGTAGPDDVAKGWIIDNVVSSGPDVLDQAFSGLIVKDSNTGLQTQITDSRISTGGAVFATSTKSVNYSVARSDYTIRADAALNTINITLPDATAITGQIFKVKKIDSTANTVTINTTSSQLIDGSLTAPINIQYTCITVQSNGTGWDII